MKKTAYIVGNIEMILGLLTLVFTFILREAIPVIVGAVYQAAAVSSFSADDYAVNFSVSIGISVVLCFIGTGTILYSVLVKKD